uniref:t-SNARE coiled-coil homology domain-containing protein n=1 Tax=Ascaris lumbricoides TaxID=6252 RepID=A0A0M3HIM7_ASCLU
MGPWNQWSLFERTWTTMETTTRTECGNADDHLFVKNVEILRYDAEKLDNIAKQMESVNGDLLVIQQN